MKYFCLLFILFVVFLSCSPPESVEFPDPNLAAVVRKALDLAPDKPIRLKKLEKLEKLSASKRDKRFNGSGKNDRFNKFIA